MRSTRARNGVVQPNVHCTKRAPLLVRMAKKTRSKRVVTIIGPVESLRIALLCRLARDLGFRPKQRTTIGFMRCSTREKICRSTPIVSEKSRSKRFSIPHTTGAAGRGREDKCI